MELTLNNGVINIREVVLSYGPNLFSPTNVVLGELINNSGETRGYPVSSPTWARTGFIPVEPNTRYKVFNKGNRNDAFIYTADNDVDSFIANVGIDAQNEFLTTATTLFSRFNLSTDYTAQPGPLTDFEVRKEIQMTTFSRELEVGTGAAVRKGWNANEVQITTSCGKTIHLLANFVHAGTLYDTQEAAITLLESLL